MSAHAIDDQEDVIFVVGEAPILVQLAVVAGYRTVTRLHVQMSRRRAGANIRAPLGVLRTAGEYGRLMVPRAEKCFEQPVHGDKP
jgi:hypothetical protein